MCIFGYSSLLMPDVHVPDSHGFPVALCCIVAGKDDVPFATVPKYYQKN